MIESKKKGVSSQSQYKPLCSDDQQTFQRHVPNANLRIAFCLAEVVAELCS